MLQIRPRMGRGKAKACLGSEMEFAGLRKLRGHSNELQTINDPVGPSPLSIEDCYCFSTLNPKIAFVPSGPLKDHTLNLHSHDLLPLRSGAPVYGPNEG